MAESTSNLAALQAELRERLTELESLEETYSRWEKAAVESSNLSGYRLEQRREEVNDALKQIRSVLVPGYVGNVLGTLARYSVGMSVLGDTEKAIRKLPIANGTLVFTYYKAVHQAFDHLRGLLNDLQKELARELPKKDTPYSDEAQTVFAKLGAPVFESMDNPAILKHHRSKIRRWLGKTLSDEAIRSMLKRIREAEGLPSSSQVKKNRSAGKS